MDAQSSSVSQTASPQPAQTPNSTAVGGPLAALAFKLENGPARIMQQGVPTKNDKPRPHICAECQRPFARLEHLKRHERSHTKEKPFDCITCGRAFARRDLLLRHQQKLHNAGAPGSRIRGQRRGSGNDAVAGGTGPSGASHRIRKNSTSNASNALAKARPRANTLGHLDFASLMLGDNAGLVGSNLHAAFPQDSLAQRHDDLAQRHRLSDGAIVSGHAGHHTTLAAHLPKLRTQSYDHNLVHDDATIRSAPAGSFFQQPLFQFPVQPSLANHAAGPGTTVNPAELHFPPSFDSPITPVDDMAMFGPPTNLSGGDMPWEDLFGNRNGLVLCDGSAVNDVPMVAPFQPDFSVAATFETEAAISPWLMDGAAGHQANLNADHFPLVGNSVAANASLPMFDGVPTGMMSTLMDTTAFPNLAVVGERPAQAQAPPGQHHGFSDTTLGPFMTPSGMSMACSADTPGSTTFSVNGGGSGGHSSVTSTSGSLATDPATRQVTMTNLVGPCFEVDARVM